jgi:hypothetical protein
MNNRVAIWANRTQVIDRVNFVFLPDVRKLLQVVNLDKTVANFAVLFCETEATDTATCTVMSNTFLACFVISTDCSDVSSYDP